MADQGLGQGLFNTGLFEGGPSTWGIGEWSVIAVGGYLAFEIVSSHPAVKKTQKRARGAVQQGSMTIGNVVLLGAAAYAAWWAWNAYQTGGLGAYESQNYVVPQILTDPTNSAQVQIPAGW